MKLLAIDTTQAACSAAIYCDGEVHEQYALAPREHTHRLLPMMETVLAEAGVALAELDALAFACGPGSFTGLRIAAASIQGVALAQDLPVVPVSSLAGMAQGAVRVYGYRQILAGFDARMAEVYWGMYRYDEQRGIVEPVMPDVVSPPEQLSVPEQGIWAGVGDAWQTYEQVLQQHFADKIKEITPDNGSLHAQDIARLAVVAYQQGKAVVAEQALPVYLRDQVAHKKA
ncbi:MAG TPA: tRNA (adenosine(37)-N6)-threonylcarbamoyltransferase complex dimerization subunit type 1 TsaB [Gammaproteobacteria bacterium]|nr:tRNA (adenosine(37)-N6)-threonylcarbamoyltransferase complex dimerization subunit type 1 TsaB [Gammaproteobacteria bacterium]